MSESDTFIDEVSEEVRRDKLFAMMRKWGWVPALAVALLVGGAAYSEWQKAQDRERAENLGDAILTALEQDESAQRVSALMAIEAGSVGGQAVIAFLQASEQAREKDFSAAASSLAVVASNSELPLIYRQIAEFKALTIDSSKSTADRREGFAKLADPGARLRLMAEEQIAYIDLEEGHTTAALDRLQRVVVDAEVTDGLRRRVVQVIVALGGVPDTIGQPETIQANE